MNEDHSNDELRPSRGSPGNGPDEHTVFEWAQGAGELPRVLEELHTTLARRRRRRRVGAGLLAAVMAVCTWTVFPGADPDETLQTAGQIRRAPNSPRLQELADGTIVELKANAKLEVRFDAHVRRVVLHSGEAFFQVAKNPARPFVVDARGLGVRAVGTAFAVNVEGGVVDVLVTEGKVAVEKPRDGVSDAGPAQAGDVLATLAPKHRVRVEPGSPANPLKSVEVLSDAAVQHHLAWRQPRLEFMGAPLTDVIAEFNRHNLPQLVLADPKLGALEISGILRADNTRSLLRLLEGEFNLRAERQGDSIVIRR